MPRHQHFAEIASRTGHDALIAGVAGEGLRHTVASDHLPSECAEWLDENVRGAAKWVFDLTSGRTTFRFAHADEAFTFKMCWG